MSLTLSDSKPDLIATAERNLALEAVRVTEAAALSASLWVGRGDEKLRAKRCGIIDLARKYELDDLAHGNLMFAATGVTNGTMLKGVRRFAGGASTHSIIMRSKTGTVRMIEATHNFRRKKGYS